MERVRLDDFTKYKFLSGLEYNPTGDYACFVVHNADMEANDYNSNLWLYDVKADNCTQLTAFDKEKGFIWLDDEHILFPGMRNPRDKEKAEAGEVFTVFYKISIKGGEAREAFRVPLAVRVFKKLQGAQYLFTATYNPHRPSLDGLTDAKKAKALKERKEEKDYEVLEEIPFWSNGVGFTSKNRNRLYIFDSVTGQYEALSDELTDVGSLRLNQEKTQAILIAQTWQGMMEIAEAMYILDIETKVLRQLTQQEKFSWADAHFIRDKILALGSDMQRHGLNQNATFYLVNAETGERTLLTPDFDESTWNSVGSDCRLGGGDPHRVDGEYLYFVTTRGGNSYLNRIDIQGRIELVITSAGSVDCYDVRQGQVLFVGMRELRLQELYSLEGTEERHLTSFNKWVHEERTLASLEPLSVETAPGITIDGWVMKPVGYEAGKQYPAILDIHGGPKTVYGTVFFHEMQYWANEGYYVFFCNPRGSDGKGNEFADIRGKYGTIDYDDIMAFTDAVLAKYPDIDQGKVGVTGGSYGGFMTNWIIGHTDRFKAAASQRSISNWVSMGYTTDIGYFFEEDQIATTPWMDIDKVWWHSPLKYADQVKTPTLFIHSEQDYRCWLVEGLQMFTALKYFGIDSRLCMFRGENHELSRSGKPTHRIRRLKEITDWFNKYLK